MMYTYFLYAALLLTNSFFSLQPMTMVLQRDNMHALPKENRLRPALQKHIQQKKDAQATPETKSQTIVNTNAITRTLCKSDCVTNEDGETPGAYFDRLEAENERNRLFYTAGLLLLAQDKTISAKYKDQIFELTKKEDWVEQYYKLHELEFRKKSILQTQGVFTEVLPHINPEYIPTSILVPAYPYSKKDIVSSISMPLQTVEIRDCDYKIIDQLSTTHRSFWSWLFTQRKPTTAFFVPAQTKEQKAEGKPMYVECVDTLSEQFDTKGELGIAGASFQNCHEITDSKTIGDLQKNPHEIPGMLYMSAADGGTYVILSGLGTASAFMPVLVPVAMGGAAGYILWEIFKETEEGKAFIAAWKDRSEKKAARKAEEAKAKAERKAQEEKLKAELKAEQEKNKNGGGGPKKPDDDKDKKKGLNKKQQKELNNQNRNPAKNEPVGDKGVYEDAGYHHPNSKGVKSQAPKNGQKALNNSVIVKEKGNNNYQRRVGISDGEIVVLDETSPGKYHGHVRTWKEICNDIGSKDLKKILLDNGLVDKKGNILCR